MNKASIYSQMENWIARMVHEHMGEEVEKNVYDYSMMASPNYHIIGERGFFSCDTFTYRIYGTSRLEKCEVLMKRMDAEFVIQGDMIQRDKFEWYQIQNMLPWEYKYDEAGHIHVRTQSEIRKVLPEKLHNSDAENRIQIRNLQNYFFEKQVSSQMDLFTDFQNTLFYMEDYTKEPIYSKEKIEELFCRWAKYQAEDHGRYVMLGVSGAPVIEINESGNRAEGLYVVEVFCANKIREKDTLTRSIYQLRATYFKESEWKIASMHMDKLVDLPKEKYTGGTRYDHMSQCPGVWFGGNEKREGSFPEDIYEIETLLSRWFYACRRGELEKFYHRDMENSDETATLYIKSQGAKSKKCIGTKEIAGRLSGMDAMYNSGQYSFHTATTPVIEISSDGLSAKGTWFDQSATNLMNREETKDVIPYMVFVFRYIHEFLKVDGKWYLIHFFAKPVISTQDWYYNSLTAKGWVNESQHGYYPLPKAEEGSLA